MKRKIIRIDEEKCNGCGLCAAACHEGAIGMENGKAKLMREDYCDGLGDCLPACPTGAISFEEREAPAYDEAAVRAAKLKKFREEQAGKTPLPCGCPGHRFAPHRARAGGRRELRRARAQRTFAVACADQAGARARALLRRGRPAHRGGLHGIRVRRFSPPLYPQPHRADRLPQAGRGRLCRKADSHPFG